MLCGAVIPELQIHGTWYFVNFFLTTASEWSDLYVLLLFWIKPNNWIKSHRVHHRQFEKIGIEFIQIKCSGLSQVPTRHWTNVYGKTAELENQNRNNRNCKRPSMWIMAREWPDTIHIHKACILHTITLWSNWYVHQLKIELKIEKANACNRIENNVFSRIRHNKIVPLPWIWCNSVNHFFVSGFYHRNGHRVQFALYNLHRSHSRFFELQFHSIEFPNSQFAIHTSEFRSASPLTLTHSLFYSYIEIQQ